MTTETKPIIWFDGRESTRPLPPECIAECSASGDQTTPSEVGLRNLILMVL